MTIKGEKEVILTKEGLQKLEDELEYLKSTKREELAERIKQAIAFGDISENSEYEDAKNEQAFVEGRIMSLEKTLKNARLMDETDSKGNVVHLGSRITLQEVKSGRKVEVVLVSSVESKLKDGKISDESPVGRAVLGRAAHDVVEVEAPAGIIKYKIVKIHK
jgi:transcription elongation factor GreA